MSTPPVHSPVDRARAYLSKVPPAISGQRGHTQTFAAACAIVHGFALPEGEALKLLREYNNRCRPLWTEKELRHKIKSARTARHQTPRGHLLNSDYLRSSPRTVTASKPQHPPDFVAAVKAYLGSFRFGGADLWEASPVRLFDHWQRDGIAIVESLFHPGELVNFVTSATVVEDEPGRKKAIPNDAGETVERDVLLARWRREGMPCVPAGGWLRMNPLDGKGIADENVAKFRFALVESDTLPLGLQLALMAHLPLPISAMLTSGCRSIHSLVKVDAKDASDYRQSVGAMLDILRRFGVDSQNRNPSRMSRLPGVLREIGAGPDARQRLLYLNPEPKQEAIL